MGRLNNKEFLDKVDELLKANDGKSSVYLTQKRLSSLDVDDSTSESLNDLPSNVLDTPGVSNVQHYPVLIRVTMNGSTRGDKKDKVKISTVVEHDQLPEFWGQYSQALKNGFVNMKKKNKKKQKKSKVSKP
jgi:signal recognition particle subunit SRP14